MTPAFERARAEQLRPGDSIASTRTQEFVRVEAIESIGEFSRYIRLEGGARIRPRHDTRFWRKVRP